MSSGTLSGAGPGRGDELLAQPLQFFKGVGPKRAELLGRLFLHTVKDLLFFFPVAHKDRASVTPIARLRLGQESNLRAQIVDVRAKQFPNGKVKVEALLADESGEVKAGWWNPYVSDKLTPRAWGFFSGKFLPNQKGREFSSPEFEILSEPGDEADEDSGAAPGKAPVPGPVSPNFGRIVPVYSLRPKQRRPDGSEPPEVGLNQSLLRRVVWQALETGAAERLCEHLPEPLRARRELPGLALALRQMHFPDSFADLERARRRLAYEELFLLSLGVALRRVEVERQTPARRLPLTPAIQARIAARLPFQFTAAQARAFREIAADLDGARPMNRLLQGDVGCGKTAVAVGAMLLAVAHGAQAALLAPTEVLAEQHARTLGEFLAGSRVRIGLLRGSARASERAAFLKDLAAGECHLAIGTQALLEPDVHFKDLALTVMDEQHKFGVAQRQQLRAKGRAPHVLVMTATPIPRSLALTLYGDLDLSVIDAFPPGRGEVVTQGLKEAQRPQAHKLIRQEARAGHATYVVLPRIEGEDVGALSAQEDTAGVRELRRGGKLWSEVKGVEEELQRVRAALPDLRAAALHGRMSGEEKDRVLGLLRTRQLDVLVSTQVIEVGIDVPHATVLLIENAEMFGLANLHQLRGRIGRSGLKSWCLFFGQAKTDEAKERLKTFAATRDGFQIAEADFRLRGPGQFFGTAQSGLPELTVADLVRDQSLLQSAREDAFALVRADPDLAAAEHALLRERVHAVLGGRIRLVDVG